MAYGCRDLCLRYKTTEKFRGQAGGIRYSDSTCWCKTCQAWLDREKAIIRMPLATNPNIVSFRCICCHGKVRLMARAHWRHKQ